MPTHLGWPHRAWLSFIELDKAVVLVWLDLLVFCDYGFSVSALLQHLPSYLGFSYLGCGLSLHGCSSKAQLLLLILDEAYLLTAALPDLEHGIAPLGPPAPTQPPLLGCGVAPLGRHPWPRMWGSSSWPFLCCCSLALRAIVCSSYFLLHFSRITVINYLVFSVLKIIVSYIFSRNRSNPYYYILARDNSINTEN